MMIIIEIICQNKFLSFSNVKLRNSSYLIDFIHAFGVWSCESLKISFFDKIFFMFWAMCYNKIGIWKYRPDTIVKKCNRRIVYLWMESFKEVWPSFDLKFDRFARVIQSTTFYVNFKILKSMKKTQNFIKN